MINSPIKLTVYDPETNEEVKTLSTAFVPWGVMKKAVAFVDRVNGDVTRLSDQDLEMMTALVCAAFGDRVTAGELEKGADAGEMFTVIKAIIGRVNVQDGGRGVAGLPLARDKGIIQGG